MENRDGLSVLVGTVIVSLLGLVILGACGVIPNPYPSGVGDSTGQVNYQSSLPIKAPVPRSLLIPKIGVNATPIVPLGLNKDGMHEVPPVNKPEQVGWYEPGPEPGDRGPAILLGHVNGGGRAGVFGQIHMLVKGDDVYVDDKLFTVTDVKTVEKSCTGRVKPCISYADIADSIYNETPGPELRLITCGGEFDRTAKSYEDNIVVYGKLKVTLP